MRGPDQAAEHRRHQGNVRAVRCLRQQPGGFGAVEHVDGSTCQRSTEQDQQPADVRRETGTHPGVERRRIEGRQRSRHGRAESRPREVPRASASPTRRSSRRRPKRDRDRPAPGRRRAPRRRASPAAADAPVRPMRAAPGPIAERRSGRTTRPRKRARRGSRARPRREATRTRSARRRSPGDAPSRSRRVA